MKKLWQTIFSKQEVSSFIPYNGKIEVFYRSCIFSSISHRKLRIPHFSKEKCYHNLIQTMDSEKANLTKILDVAKGDREGHFLSQENVIEIREGTESGAFLRLIEYVAALNLHPETIVYFVEDDYLHRPGWVDVLLEGFQIESADYVTLYDHRDKYFYPMYNNLKSRIFATSSCHWRTTPSTTQTFAMRFKTLLRDLKIHKKYSEGVAISKDHQKFLHLQKKGRCLISSVPGWSTHAEPKYASPCTNWESFLTEINEV